MRQLTTEDLKTLEVDLKNYFPQSLQVLKITKIHRMLYFSQTYMRLNRQQ